MFPYAGMPPAAQWISEILPMTDFIRLIRAIMLRGASLSDLPMDMLALAVIAALLLPISTRRISKRLD